MEAFSNVSFEPDPLCAPVSISAAACVAAFKKYNVTDQMKFCVAPPLPYLIVQGVAAMCQGTSQLWAAALRTVLAQHISSPNLLTPSAIANLASSVYSASKAATTSVSGPGLRFVRDCVNVLLCASVCGCVSVRLCIWMPVSVRVHGVL